MPEEDLMGLYRGRMLRIRMTGD